MAARDTSLANPSTAGSSLPTDSEARNAVNARIIGRKDAFFAEIVDYVGIVSLYHYEPEVGSYVKQSPMGPLFLIRRSPEYALYMINRTGVKNHFWGLYPSEMRITAHDKEKILEVARRGEPERPRFWLDDPEPLRRIYDRINSIVGPPVKPEGGNATAPSSNQPSLSSSQSAVLSPAQPTAQPQTQQQPASQDGFAQLFAGLSVVPGPNATHPAYPPQPHPHSTAVQAPVYPHYPQPPPQNPHHYTTNVAPFVGPQAPHSHYSSSPAPGHSDTSTPQPSAPPAMSPPTFAPHETADGLFKSLLGGGNTSFPPMPQPPPHGPSGAVSTPPPTTGSPVRGPPGMTQPMRGGPPQRGFPGHRGGGPGPTNGHVSPPRNQPQQQPPFPPQPFPPPMPSNFSPEGMRDALVSTFAPDNGQAQYHQVPREQLVGTLIHLLQTNPAFGNDVWSAYNARCSGGPRQ